MDQKEAGAHLLTASGSSSCSLIEEEREREKLKQRRERERLAKSSGVSLHFFHRSSPSSPAAFACIVVGDEAVTIAAVAVADMLVFAFEFFSLLPS